MFRSATKVTLDDKGRLVVPARYREGLSEQLVVTIDLSGECLLIYPLADWEPVERKLMALSTLRAESRRLQHLLVGHATDVALDGHGRMLLTQELRTMAAIDRHAVWVGQGNRCELWDETRWTERCGVWIKTQTAETALPAELESLSL